MKTIYARALQTVPARRLLAHLLGVRVIPTTILGRAQSASFIATDLLKVAGGLITDNWHIEDNLTLMKQLGVVAQ